MLLLPGYFDLLQMLVEKFESSSKGAKVLVLFGGSPVRRDQVIQSLKNIDNLTIYGTLNEEMGLEKIRSLEKVDFVLIGSRYSTLQRLRIKQILSKEFPHVRITEPGIDYPYSESIIYHAVSQMLLN